MSHWARRVDANQNEIRRALEAVGFSVASIAAAGRGVPDLLVGRLGKNYLFEVKVEGEKLTPLEVKFRDRWLGQWAVIYSAEDALREMGVAT